MVVSPCSKSFSSLRQLLPFRRGRVLFQNMIDRSRRAGDVDLRLGVPAVPCAAGFPATLTARYSHRWTHV